MLGEREEDKGAGAASYLCWSEWVMSMALEKYMPLSCRMHSLTTFSSSSFLDAIATRSPSKEAVELKVASGMIEVPIAAAEVAGGGVGGVGEVGEVGVAAWGLKGERRQNGRLRLPRIVANGSFAPPAWTGTESASLSSPSPSLSAKSSPSVSVSVSSSPESAPSVDTECVLR